MAATAITPSVRYTSQGTTKFIWMPDCADPSAPTRSEIDAGTDLSPQVADSNGWSVKTNQIGTPDLGTRYESQIPGSITADDSSLTLYMSKNGVDARGLMPRDASGFMLVADGGDVAANKGDVYPVTVSSVSKKREVQGKNADTVEISYAITDEPSENVTIPA